MVLEKAHTYTAMVQMNTICVSQRLMCWKFDLLCDSANIEWDLTSWDLGEIIPDYFISGPPLSNGISLSLTDSHQNVTCCKILQLSGGVGTH